MRLHATVARRLIGTTALVLTAALVTATPAGAAPAPDPVPANQAADWLSGELRSGGTYDETEGRYDLGLSIDTGLALADTGRRSAAVAAIANRLSADLEDFTGPGGGSDSSAGAVAKAAVFADVAGRDPRAFSGRDLVEEIEGNIATSPVPGRMRGMDEVATVDQAYAVRALAAADSDSLPDARAFLLDQQCTAGFFRADLSEVEAPEQGCTEADGPATVEDLVATALTVLQLAPQSTVAEVGVALTAARAWMTTQQDDEGFFGPPTAPTWVTGLAAWALRDSAATSSRTTTAAAWLRERQVTGLDDCTALIGEAGAVAPYDDLLAEARTYGIASSVRSSWLRATAQTLPALAEHEAEPTSTPRLSAPAGFFKQGAHPVLRTTGAAAGTQLCLRGLGASITGTTGSGSWNRSVTLPGGTRTRVYAVSDGFGHRATTSLKVLGAKTLGVATSRKRLARSSVVRVTVGGLVAGEPARIAYRGSTVGSGTASSAGRLTRSFRVGRALGVQRIAAYGRFSDLRRGANSIRVVR